MRPVNSLVFCEVQRGKDQLEDFHHIDINQNASAKTFREDHQKSSFFFSVINIVRDAKVANHAIIVVYKPLASTIDFCYPDFPRQYEERNQKFERKKSHFVFMCILISLECSLCSRKR